LRGLEGELGTPILVSASSVTRVPAGRDNAPSHKAVRRNLKGSPNSFARLLSAQGEGNPLAKSRAADGRQPFVNLSNPPNSSSPKSDSCAAGARVETRSRSNRHRRASCPLATLRRGLHPYRELGMRSRRERGFGSFVKRSLNSPNHDRTVEYSC
jgi:hypothetical protein